MFLNHHDIDIHKKEKYNIEHVSHTQLISFKHEMQESCIYIPVVGKLFRQGTKN